uniref:Matrix AAA peptidase interacting protein 1 n=1 Tax=Neogobius melanostomus TaxID=47308 RepID=A0A8C6WMV4_9GOBI
MALPVFRGCCRLSASLRLNRIFATERLNLIQSHKLRCPTSTARVSVTLFRPYCSDREPQRQIHKVVVFCIPNPFIWFRTKIYYFLIRAYFDKDFTIEEFTEGAKQAFSHVSRLLSQCQFQDLEGLVATDLIGKLEEKCNLLPLNYRRALLADPDDIMYTTTGDVGIYYDNDGRKFVSILMRFWYLTSARLPDDSLEGPRVYHGEGDVESKRLLTAKYEFQREFTKGVDPDWTITRIEHSKLLE